MGFNAKNVEINEADREESESLLSKYSLKDNMSYYKIAYVDNIKASTTIDGNLFYKFTMRDRDYNIVVGRMFTDKDNDFGDSFVGLQNSLVAITFDTNLYKGEISITVKSIKSIPEKDCTTDVYFSPIEDIKECKDICFRKLSEVKDSFPFLHRIIVGNKFLEKLCDMKSEHYYGRKGGAVKTLAGVLQCLSSLPFQSDYEKRKCLAYTMVSVYFKYDHYAKLIGGNDAYDLGEGKLEVIRKSDKLWSLVEDYKGDKCIEYANYYKDLAKEGRHLFNCIFEFDTPKTFTVKVILDSMEYFKKFEDIKNIYSSMPSHTYKYDNGEYLVKLGGE